LRVKSPSGDNLQLERAALRAVRTGCDSASANALKNLSADAHG
jgi:hypothetical protein